jgi:hypothetical protein
MFHDAKMDERTCYIVNSPDDRVVTIEIGNLPPLSDIILTMNLTLFAASSSANSTFDKFPFESCSQTNVIMNFEITTIQNFLFE